MILVSGLLPTQAAVEAVSGGRDDAVTTVGHFAAYVLLGFLVGVALMGWEVRARGLLMGLALAAALGGLVELVQAPLPYRGAQALRLHGRRGRRRRGARAVQCCGVGGAITMASRMMRAATSSDGTS